MVNVMIAYILANYIKKTYGGLRAMVMINDCKMVDFLLYSGVLFSRYIQQVQLIKKMLTLQCW